MTVCNNIDVQVRKKNKKSAAYDQQSALLYVYDKKQSKIDKNGPTQSKTVPHSPIPQSPNPLTMEYYKAGQDCAQTDRQTDRHINTMNRPGLRAGPIENHFCNREEEGGGGNGSDSGDLIIGPASENRQDLQQERFYGMGLNY